MRHPVVLFFLLMLTGCDTTKTGSNGTETTIPRQTPTRIVFDTKDLVYTGGLGDAGVEGFCRRLQSNVAKDFAERGVTVTSNAEPNTPTATITVTLMTIEPKSAGGLNLWTGSFSQQNLRSKYSATLQSPGGATLATWKHEVDEDGVDHLTEHMAADIVKYLKKGFSR